MMIELASVWSSLVAPVPGDAESDWCQAENYYGVYRTVGGVLMPNSILEIGARVGHSMISMAIDNPRLRNIRWIDDESYIANSNIRTKANLLGFYRTHRPDWPVPKIAYDRTYPAKESLKGQFELCHIDGDHSYDGKLRDLEYCASLDPTWILADDFNYHSQVGHAIRDWCLWMRAPLFVISSLRGLALICLHTPLVDWSAGRLREAGISTKAGLQAE